MTFDTVLIANRGEIACRIMRSAQAFGYRTVAVYSDADAGAPHVLQADAAVRIGPAPVAESYLSIEAIVGAAQRAGAGAVHPGYGFLAENADFARAVAAAGLTLIGPPVEAIELMGNKRLAKLRMEAAGVPCVPGYSGAAQDDATLLTEGEGIGFPLMVKAAAGGGGRGMRLVDGLEGLSDALASARSEALNAFGSDELILERAVLSPRHVEIQVFADSHGNCIHLGERDCSVQRRHQKVIEEAPSPAVDAELRSAMGAAAVEAARAIGYVGAGTVEFLLDGEGRFYFLEMNTRLQVEHPVTEMITGQDLVAWQLDVAAGGVLPLTQEQVRLDGHAIEVRLYAEGAHAGFLPQTGRIATWRPAIGARTDAGIAEGQEVTPFYDPMLAKIVAHGRTREEARRKLIRALEDTVLLGVTCNKGFLIDALRQPAFVAGAATTSFIAECYGEEGPAAPAWDAATRALAAVLLYRRDADGARSWRTAAPEVARVDLRRGDDGVVLQVTPGEAGTYSVVEAGMARSASLRLAPLDDGRVTYEFDGLRRRAAFAFAAGQLYLDVGDRCFALHEHTPALAAARQRDSDGRLLAPMAGRIVAVRAAVGAGVRKGEILVVLEAMKMEHEIKAGLDGVVEQIPVRQGDQVNPRQLLAVVGGDG